MIFNLCQLFFILVQIKEENIYKLMLDNVVQYDCQLEEVGGLDLMVLGLGVDGYFCGNLLNIICFYDQMVEVLIYGEMIVFIVNSEMGGNILVVLDSYVIMGLRSVMVVKNLLLIVSGVVKVYVLK